MASLSFRARVPTFDANVGVGHRHDQPAPFETPDQLLASSYEIEVAGTRVKAEASLKPMYDPKSERVKI